MATPQRSKATSATSKTRSIKSYLSAAPQRAGRSSATRSDAGSGPALEEQIQQKAYEIFQRRGGSDGLERFDWKIATTIVTLENEAGKSKSTKSRLGADAFVLDNEIQKKAYELFERRGYAHGNDAFDWALAREIVALEKSI